MISLPDGNTVGLRLVTHGLTVKVDNAFRRASRMLDGTDDWSDYQAEILLLLIESWSRPEPPSIPSIEALDATTVDLLWDAALDHYRAASGRTVDAVTLGQTEDPSPAASAKPSA
jgi:hypothetical protein